MDFSQEKHPAGSVWNLLLFQKFYDFDVYFEPIIERFPAFEKSAWCAQIKNTLIDTIKLILTTNKAREKLPGWYKVDTNLELLKIYIRRMREKKYLSPRTYETAEKRLAEIGKILGGLINRKS
ncbi:MAG: diversity-generating retroelement protein Avd [Treponema sp.]|nr:diversity-generating retroelement protein Avd [Treponema sp.]